MCIRHKEWREYTPIGADSPQSRFGNVYYHLDPECVGYNVVGSDHLHWKYHQKYVTKLKKLKKIICTKAFRFKYSH